MGKSKRILLTDKEGYELVRNLFSHEEILQMEILGILMIDDPNLNKVDELFENEIVYFIGESSYVQIMKGFSKFKSNVYLIFYNQISEYIINEIISLDLNNRICEINYGSLNMNVISDNCVVGEDIWTVIKNNPKIIIYHNGCGNLQPHIISMLAMATQKSAIFERVGNNLLYVIDRSYDKTTPVVIPWRYESLRHFLKLSCEGESPGTDQFYAKCRYTLYNEVIDESTKQSNNLTSLKNNGKMKDVKEKFELDEKIRIISKHIEILGKIQTLVTKQNLLVRSQLEQKALIGTASSDELKELEKMNPKLYQMVVGTGSVTIKGTLNTFNMFNKNTDKSIYHQYIPPIREILKFIKISKQGFDNVYIYIRGFICYEEVAEVALFNKEYGSKIFLLSDQIKDNLKYPCVTSNKFTRCGEHFRICKKVLKSQTYIQDVYYKNIEDKLTFLQKHNVSFDSEKERICESIKLELSSVLLKEFASLKTFKPKNKLEENIKNIKMNRLSKLSLKFSEFEKTNKRIYNEDSCFNFSKEIHKTKIFNDTGKQKLLHKDVIDNEQELRQMEELIGERDESVTTICQNLAEVHSMMLELNALVVKQGVMIESIDNNLIDASDLIKDGNVQLVKADTHQKDSNSLANKIIAGMVGLVILAGIGVGIKESVIHHH
jgi:hypothetical protein